MNNWIRTLAIILLCSAGTPWMLPAIDLPPEFEDVLVIDNLLDPASMAFAPDGRLFIGERISGNLRVVSFNPQTDQWELQPTPFYTFDVPQERHRSSGLRGFAFDPDFNSNGYIYAFYMKNNPRHNRVVRIQADPAQPNQALAGSETLLLEIPFSPTSSSGSHNGGDMLVGLDDKLYFTTGDGWNGGDDVQSLSTFTGKLFRINTDGSIPSDNPFFNETTGNYRAIYALGMRNPYTMAMNDETGILFVNDARGNNKGNIYRIQAGANYGHDGFDGIGLANGVWANAADAGGKLVTGGAWYPSSGYWPEEYRGNYFTALWGGNGSSTDGRISRIALPNGTPSVQTFATDVYQNPGRNKPVMLKIGPDQNLYYLLTDYETGTGQVRQIQYTGIASAKAPEFTPFPGQYDDPVQVSLFSPTPGATMYFTTDGSDPDEADFRYQGPIRINTTQTVKAIAIAPGLAPSSVSGGEYRIGPVPNVAPVADAGPDLIAQVGTKITLNGTASYDPDGSPLEMVEDWIQLEGPAVNIEDADETVANFTPTQTGTYRFRITITDIQGATDEDETQITVVADIPDKLDGLVARWRMEAGAGNTLQDFSPNSNPGQIEGASWDADTPDDSDFALRFDGQDDWVDIGNLDLSSSAMSITFWFKADNFNTSDARFISKASGSGDQDQYWMVSTLNETSLRFRLRTEGNTTTLVTVADVIQPDEWIHIAAVYDGSQMRIYLDGNEVASTPKTGQIDSDPQVDVALGNQPSNASGGTRPFAGWMDEVRIYGVGLTPEEVELVRMASSTIVNTTASIPVKDLSLYPLPAKDRIWVQGASLTEKRSTYQLWDNLGQLVQSGRLDALETSQSISLAGLPAGIYYFKVEDIPNAYRVLKQ